jgi:hypothetical protein
VPVSSWSSRPVKLHAAPLVFPLHASMACGGGPCRCPPPPAPPGPPPGRSGRQASESSLEPLGLPEGPSGPPDESGRAGGARQVPVNARFSRPVNVHGAPLALPLHAAMASGGGACRGFWALPEGCAEATRASKLGNASAQRPVRRNAGVVISGNLRKPRRLPDQSGLFSSIVALTAGRQPASRPPRRVLHPSQGARTATGFPAADTEPDRLSRASHPLPLALRASMKIRAGLDSVRASRKNAGSQLGEGDRDPGAEDAPCLRALRQLHLACYAAPILLKRSSM